MAAVEGRSSPVEPILLTNLSDQVHESLRAAILGVRFHDGDRLNERDLARDLGVSTTPLKEALRQLEAEGLVRIEPRRGAFVAYGPRQAEEMSLARAALESMIARQAAKHASPAILAGLGECVERMQAATAAGDVERLIALNELFHRRIHDASGCDHLRRLQERQQTYNHAARTSLLAEAEERGRALAEHRAIFDAIAAADPEEAERVMRDHVIRSGRRHIETVFGLAPVRKRIGERP